MCGPCLNWYDFRNILPSLTPHTGGFQLATLRLPLKLRLTDDTTSQVDFQFSEVSIAYFLRNHSTIVTLRQKKLQYMRRWRPVTYRISVVFLSCFKQEAAINVFSTIKKYMDDQTMRKLVLPKAKILFTKSNNVRVSVSPSRCNINAHFAHKMSCTQF